MHLDDKDEDNKIWRVAEVMRGCVLLQPNALLLALRPLFAILTHFGPKLPNRFHKFEILDNLDI